MSSAIISRSATRVPEFDVHDRARKARVSAGMQQADLMDVTGISLTSITNVENGKVAPRKSTLRLWAMATGVSYEWLMTGEVPGDDEGPSEEGPSDESRLRESNSRPFHYE